MQRIFKQGVPNREILHLLDKFWWFTWFWAVQSYLLHDTCLSFGRVVLRCILWQPRLRLSLLYSHYQYGSYVLFLEAARRFNFESVLKGIHTYRCHDYIQLIALSHLLPEFIIKHSKVTNYFLFIFFLFYGFVLLFCNSFADTHFLHLGKNYHFGQHCISL